MLSIINRISTAETTFEESLKEAHGSLVQTDGFAEVEVPFTTEQRELFTKLSVTRVGNWEFANDKLQTPLQLESIAHSFGKQERQVAANFAEALSGISDSLVRALNKEMAWIGVRTFAPHPTFRARWHIDGRYYSPATDDDVQAKFVLTVLGRSTLCARLTSDQRHSLEQTMIRLGEINVEWNKSSGSRQLELTALTNQTQEAFNDTVKDSQVVGGKHSDGGLLFSVGRRDAGVHSEPMIDTPRVFFSVIPCSEAQVQEIKMGYYPMRTGK